MRSITFPIKYYADHVCFHLLMLCDFYLANHKWPICGVFPSCGVYSGPCEHLVLPDLFSVSFCRYQASLKYSCLCFGRQFNNAVTLMLISSKHIAKVSRPLCRSLFWTNSQNIGSVQVLNYTSDRCTCCCVSSSICSICCSVLFHRKLFWISSGSEWVTWGHGSYRTL